MAYNTQHVTLTEHIKTAATAIRTDIQTLSARYDANVKASTDSDADYAAEVADGRVDTWGNEQSCLGANIREGQKRISNSLILAQEVLQEQLDDVSQAILKQAVMLSEIKELLRSTN